MDAAELAGLNPFGIFDLEAARLDHFFSGLDEAAWNRPSRCPGWTVRDVLSHLAGEELYNHACLNGDLETFRATVRAAGITGGYDEFNQWCVRQRRGLPTSEVLAEWREANGETRHRMTELGRDAPLTTAAGPYPAGLQAFHYSSEYATHADDVGAPVAPAEATGTHRLAGELRPVRADRAGRARQGLDQRRQRRRATGQPRDRAVRGRLRRTPRSGGWLAPTRSIPRCVTRCAAWPEEASRGLRARPSPGLRGAGLDQAAAIFRRRLVSW